MTLLSIDDGTRGALGDRTAVSTGYGWLARDSIRWRRLPRGWDDLARRCKLGWAPIRAGDWRDRWSKASREPAQAPCKTRNCKTSYGSNWPPGTSARRDSRCGGCGSDLRLRQATGGFSGDAFGGPPWIVGALGQGRHRAQGFDGAGRAFGGVFFQQPCNPAFEPGRDVAAQLLHCMGSFLEVGVDQFGNILAVKGGMARDCLVKNAAEGIEIGAVIDRQALKLFRRHVMDGAHEGIEVVDGLGLRAVEVFGQAEIENFDLEERGGGGPGNHEIAGLEV